MSSFVQLRHLEKSYGDEPVLRGVDLEIAEGEFFFLLGPSGCGKTTLLRILSGLLLPDAGSVWLKGVDITRLPAHKRDINTVFQNYALFPHMNVYDNVAFGLRMKKLGESRIREKVTQALKLVDLSDFGGRMPGQMSGGQMQRVALARALVNEPAVLLLDEPLGALDVKLRKQMQLELRQIQRKLGTTFICVTHDQDEALTLGDRIAVMNKGRFEQIADADTLYNKPESFYVCDFLGECNFIPKLLVQGTPGEELGAFGHLDDAVIHIPTQRGSFVKANQQYTLGIRPEKLRIAKSSVPESGFNRVHLRITERIFTGAQYTLVGSTPGGHLFRFLVPNSSESFIPAIGDVLAVDWKVADTIVLER